MNTPYLDTPNAALALNFKVGSSSLARATILAHHPKVNKLLTQGMHYPQGISPDNLRWHGRCPKVKPEDRDVVLLPIRDPIEKFCSACAETRKEDVDALLDELEQQKVSDVHFGEQYRYAIEGKTKLYRFPDHLESLAQDAGLAYPLPDIDGGHNRPKPELTEEQTSRVTRLYQKDIALYESIEEAGQDFTQVAGVNFPEPVPQKVTPRQIRLALIDRGIMPEQITQMLTAIEDETLRAKSLAEWEFASTVRRDHPLIEQLATALEFAAADVDEIFREAAAV